MRGLARAVGAKLSCGCCHRKDKYRVGKVTTQVHNLIQPMCKYRRRTVTRLRLLAQRMPRAAALQGTAVEALDGNWTGPMKVERRKEWRTAGPTLCLLAAELAASLPSYVPVQGAPGRVSMISCVVVRWRGYW